MNYDSLSEFRSALSDELHEKFWYHIECQDALHLPVIGSIRCLSVLFGYTPGFLGLIVNNSHQFYRSFNLLQKGKVRTIRAPRVSLKVLQKWIADRLLCYDSPPDCVFGFVRGRTHIDAASRHCGSQWLLQIDIKDYFSSIDSDWVYEALRKIGYDDHSATIISKLCTFNRSLPMGAPSSPVLSNIVFRAVDERISRWADAEGLVYTRYADDMVISAKDSRSASTRFGIIDIVQSEGYRLVAKKTQFMQRTGEMIVHGLNVSGHTPKITKAMKNRLRAYNYIIEKNRCDSPADQRRLRGFINYCQQVDLYVNT